MEISESIGPNMLDRLNIPNKTGGLIKETDVIIFPFDDECKEYDEDDDSDSIFFASDALSFYNYVLDYGNNLRVYYYDEEGNEACSACSSIISLGKIYVKSTLISIVLGIISNFCYDQLKVTINNQRPSNTYKENTNREVEFTICTDDKIGNTIGLHYQGSVKDLIKLQKT